MAQLKKTDNRHEIKETRLLIEYGFKLARDLGLKTVLVVGELITDRKMVDQHRKNETIIWVSRGTEKVEENIKEGDHQVEIPHSPVERMEQITLALILSVMHGYMRKDESIVCLVGVSGSKRLDNLLIANPERDFDWFKGRGTGKQRKLPTSQEFIRLIDLALRFATEGREGKPIGTIFLLGDMEELNSIARPLILNPCKGHPRKSRSIYDREFVETMREYAALDGGFLIDRKGVVEAAAVYLDAPVTKAVQVPSGLGSRHVAAAAATAQTNSIAIVISESSGTVTVFSKGAKVLSLG
ncbi:MAG: diadenylate cyclase [Verrucomicrobia bacterium]|nr:diadenylate cyclase [Verrucomicrobiota bacterium]